MYSVTDCETIDVFKIGWGYIPVQSLCNQNPNNYVSNPSNN